MKLVYLAGPISKGDLAHNINQGTAAFIALTKAGIAAICPMWSVFSGNAYAVRGTPYSEVVNTRFGVPVDLSDCVFAIAGARPNDLTHADWLKIDFEYIRRCDAVLRLPGESVGADMETEEADRLGIPVFDSVDSVTQWASPNGIDGTHC